MVDCVFKQPYMADLNPPAVIVSNDVMTSLIGLRHLLHICEKDAATTRLAKEAVSAPILVALPNASETLKSYYKPASPRPAD